MLVFEVRFHLCVFYPLCFSLQSSNFYIGLVMQCFLTMRVPFFVESGKFEANINQNENILSRSKRT